MRSILSPAPFDLVDLLLYFERLQVVEFRLMRLKLCMEFVLASFLLLRCQLHIHGCTPAQGLVVPHIMTDCFISLEEYHTPTLITSGKVVSSVVEFDGRDYVR